MFPSLITKRTFISRTSNQINGSEKGNEQVTSPNWGGNGNLEGC